MFYSEIYCRDNSSTLMIHLLSLLFHFYDGKLRWESRVNNTLCIPVFKGMTFWEEPYIIWDLLRAKISPDPTLQKRGILIPPFGKGGAGWIMTNSFKYGAGCGRSGWVAKRYKGIRHIGTKEKNYRWRRTIFNGAFILLFKVQFTFSLPDILPPFLLLQTRFSV